MDEFPLPEQEADGNAGYSQHTLVRRDLVAERPGQPARTGAGDVHHGAWRQHHHANAGSGPRHRETRTASRLRSLSDGMVGAFRAQERYVSFAGVHQLRNGWVAYGLEPVAAMGREDRRAGVRIEKRLRQDVSVRPQVRLL